MRSALIALLVLTASALPVGALAGSNTDAPAGIAATSMKLAQILTLHRQAQGELAATQTATENWTFTRGDMSGTLTRVAVGDDYREDTALGPFRSAAGSYRGQSWSQNENGLTVRETGIHERDAIDEHALKHALAPDSGVKLLGETAGPGLPPAAGRSVMAGLRTTF